MRKLQANILEVIAKTIYTCKDLEEAVQKRWAMIADVPKELLTLEEGSIKTMMKGCPARFCTAAFVPW